MFVISVNIENQPLFRAELHTGEAEKAQDVLDFLKDRLPASEGFGIRLDKSITINETIDDSRR